MGSQVTRVCFVFAIFALAIASVNCNDEGDILSLWKANLVDPNNVLQSWDPTLVNPCTWFHISCNINNSVIRIDLGNATLSGPLVPQLGGLKFLQYLYLVENNIYGEIPKELGRLQRLVSFDLSNNNLTGALPNSFGNLTSLRFLRVDNNLLSGKIPASLGNLRSLEIIDLSSNKFTGDIPIGLLLLVRYGKMTVLNVSKNLLAGTVAGNSTVTTIIQDPKAPILDGR